jgi:crotonobetaine/carnitine-CoA ligase
VWSGWPFFEARLVDEADREVPAGDTGELIVRSGVPWTITPGYFGQPAATAEAWRNGWFHTGDLFRSDADGWFYFVDRRKDCIRRRGENISSFEVEGAALRHPDVAEAAAVAYPSDTNEDEIRLFLVAAAGRPVEPAAVVAHLEDELPGFMVPRFVEVLPELPKTPTLRTQKHELRRRPLAPDVWDREAVAAGDGRRRPHR